MALKLTFAITSYNDGALAQKSKAALEAIYPGCTVLVIEDNPRLKIPPFAGQWTERWMKAALLTDCDIIMKLDPDTRAVKVAEFPSLDLFGYMAPKGTYYPKSDGIISGGAIGFQRAAVQKIVESGLLLDTKYNVKPYATEERRYQPREIVLLQDPMVADVAKQLGLISGNWEGLWIRFSWEPPVPVPADATFVHPVKE